MSQDMPSDPYDIIVVGRGLLGLIAAALLSKHGLTVCHLVEDDCDRSPPSDIYALEMDINDIVGLDTPAVMHVLMDLGLSECFAKNDSAYTVALPDGTTFVTPCDSECFAEFLTGSFPKEKASISTLMRVARKVWRGRSSARMQNRSTLAYLRSLRLPDDILLMLLAPSADVMRASVPLTMKEFSRCLFARLVDGSFRLTVSGESLRQKLYAAITAAGGCVRTCRMINGVEFKLEDDDRFYASKKHTVIVSHKGESPANELTTGHHLISTYAFQDLFKLINADCFLDVFCRDHLPNLYATHSQRENAVPDICCLTFSFTRPDLQLKHGTAQSTVFALLKASARSVLTEEMHFVKIVAGPERVTASVTCSDMIERWRKGDEELTAHLLSLINEHVLPMYEASDRAFHLSQTACYHGGFSCAGKQLNALTPFGFLPSITLAGTDVAADLSLCKAVEISNSVSKSILQQYKHRNYGSLVPSKYISLLIMQLVVILAVLLKILTKYRAIPFSSSS